MLQISMKPAVNGLAIIWGVNHKMHCLRIKLSPGTEASKSEQPIDHQVMGNLFQTSHSRVPGEEAGWTK
jgi:hypothetical protein